jgi:hypothetical protein
MLQMFLGHEFEGDFVDVLDDSSLLQKVINFRVSFRQWLVDRSLRFDVVQLVWPWIPFMTSSIAQQISASQPVAT